VERREEANWLGAGGRGAGGLGLLGRVGLSPNTGANITPNTHTKEQIFEARSGAQAAGAGAGGGAWGAQRPGLGRRSV
jgi:hypothetical protein